MGSNISERQQRIPQRQGEDNRLRLGKRNSHFNGNSGGDAGQERRGFAASSQPRLRILSRLVDLVERLDRI
jgi:hypothetical protein